MNYAWERLADGVSRCRLPFLDVTVGLVWSRTGAVLIDTGTTPTEARAIRDDVEALAGREVSHIVLTHSHFDHVLGSSQFDGAAVYCAPAVAAAMVDDPDLLRADAVAHGANPKEVDEAIAALRPPAAPGVVGRHRYRRSRGCRQPSGPWAHRPRPDRHGHRCRPDRGLLRRPRGGVRRSVHRRGLRSAAWPATMDRLLEVGGEGAVYVPGHGALVDSGFVRRQRRWLAERL